MLKGLGNLASLLRQAHQLSNKMQEMNDRLKSQRVTASSGAGMVEVEVNGLGEVLRVKIDPSLVERGEREMIEDLLPAAVNEATARARKVHVEAMKSIASGIDIPGMEDALAQLASSRNTE
jgi:DNA-binding YbaB/EbfC family protein